MAVIYRDSTNGKALQLLEALTEETLTVAPVDTDNPKGTWFASLETIGEPTKALGEDAIHAMATLWDMIKRYRGF